MQHYHPMPFGAQVEDDGRVRFRLWAPGARAVELCLVDATGDILLPMSPQPGGWFGLTTDLARAGSRYLYRIDRGMRVPDPASRHQPEDVHGPSEVIDPRAWAWADDDWRGRPWEEAVIYELHVGAFCGTCNARPEAGGTFARLLERLDHLVDLGVTAVELMPLADFPGRRNWGYDGVFLFAPDSSYGRPEDLKRLIDEAHRRRLMVFLDVVYNHFGPEGNYLHLYAPQFFTERHHTPWGAAIDFDPGRNATVRRFFVHNLLFWLEEYRFDGLRLDAVDWIRDETSPHILEELATTARQGPGRRREIHLVLENDDNRASYLVRDQDGRPRYHNAQWNDDLHRTLHVLLTGERGGRLADYQERPLWYLGRCLAEGFGYQGEWSVYRGGERGDPHPGLPPTAFVSFLQNHDQTGNRPFGERIAVLCPPERLRAALGILLLAPAVPLLFMGEEFAADQPFLFFCDFGPDLAAAVDAGRRRGYLRYLDSAELAACTTLPHPNDPATFARSQLDWASLEREPHASWLRFYRTLLALRRERIVPRLFGMQEASGEALLFGERGLRVRWRLGDGSELTLLANLGDQPAAWGSEAPPPGELLHAEPAGPGGDWTRDPSARGMPPWCVLWYLRSAPERQTDGG